MNNAKVISEGLKAAGYTVSGGVNAPYIWLKTPEGMTSWEFFDYLLDKANVVNSIPNMQNALSAAVKKRPPAFTSSVHGQRTAHCPSPCLRSMMLIANTFLTTATALGKAFGTESCTRQTTW